MELYQVRYFLAVCEELNFTRAAECSNVSQPALTRAIQKLEEELGGQLFRRERNLTHMTELARVVKPHLESIVQSAEAVKFDAEGYQNLDKPQLRLGVMCTIGPARMVSFFAALRKKLPNLELDLVEASATKITEDMMSGTLDIALIALPEFPERLDCVPLYKERYMIAFPRGHRFEEMTTVSVSELDGEDYLERVNCEYMSYFRTLDIEFPGEEVVRYRCEREDWIQAMISSGFGCSIMPEYMPFMNDIPTRVLVEPELTREIELVTVAGRQYSPAVKAFLDLAKNHDWMA